MNRKIDLHFYLVLFAIMALVFLFMPLPAGPALAQTPSPSDDEVNRIAKQLFCPVCENVPLDECQTAACEQWRELIRQKLAEGWSEDEIKAFFVAQYGDRVLGAPPRRGAHWLIYVLPPMVFLFGLGILFRHLKRAPVRSHAGPNDKKDPYLKKVEQDLKKLAGEE